MALPMKGHHLIHFLFVFSTTTDVGAFLFDADSCTRYAEYKDLINLAHVENCLSIDKVFTKLKQLGDYNDQYCFSHVLYQLGDRYGVSVQTSEDCQCNGTNSLLNYQYNVQDGTWDRKDQCLRYELNYKALFDQFFLDHGNTAPACRSHHSVWFHLSRIQDFNCAKDLIYHLKYSFDHHPSPCVCQHRLHAGDPNDCMQFHSYQALLTLKDTNLCTSKNSQWDLLHDLEIRSPLCRKNIITDLARHFHNPLSMDPCRCQAVKPISNDELPLVEGKLIDCSSVQTSSYSHLRRELFLGARDAGCTTHFHLWQQLQNIQPFKGYDCTMDLILRTANKYPSRELDPCKCTGELSTSTTSTTTTATSTTTTATNTTTTTISTTTTTTTSVAPYPSHSQISTTTTTSHVTNTPSTTTANNQPQTSDGAMSTTRNPACAKFDPTVRPCRDASVCSKPHMKEVLCPDPDQAHYCPVTCGCCVPETAEMIG
ncbi:uncharacterized protein LOC127848230 isoform X5 [Dreissena polymorpha]|uniref:uncharacterized protein LOC127848230 isoform X3 n=1 Tax=Dreissena polymorpha TaxID=45954 RepID=UPI002263FF56|nr:uncharacterized protein LOC127848230 isoform X3 [Dreissena polymorpha]XP_052236525.1 uncharacterized protein LOC127848230 isoform X4 [Dreissena polymorpha]XP_052236526.1 uncharacterized protein LOC127848230 isoform X5 [Dreissena polymorpha]